MMMVVILGVMEWKIPLDLISALQGLYHDTP